MLGASKAGLLRAAGAAGSEYGNTILLLQPMSADSTLVDYSSNAYTISGTATLTSSPTSRGEKAIDCTSGKSAALTVDGNFDFGTEDFCVEAIVRTARANYPVLVNLGGGSNNILARAFHVGDGGPFFKSEPNNTDVAVTTSFTANTYIHLAYYRLGGLLYIAVDGTVAGGASFTGNVGTSSGTLNIGKDSGGVWPLNNYIDCLRIVKGASIYGASNFTPPTSFPTS